MADQRPAVIGVVVELLPNALFRVEVDATHQVMAHVTGPVHRNFIRLVAGDRVRVELSPHDSARGRIVERLT